MTEVYIRQYQPLDCEDLANIYYNTIHTINIKDYNETQVNAWAPIATKQAEGWAKKWEKLLPWVALLDNKRVGFVEFEESGHIDCFYCHHDYQGKGIGKALMDQVKKIAKENNIQRIWAEVSITAKPFFEHQGFKVVKQQTVNVRGVDLINYVMEFIT
ncbi:MAG: GNAT family N-acetyltransferase [Candidatus Berkiella sp.]